MSSLKKPPPDNRKPILQNIAEHLEKTREEIYTVYVFGSFISKKKFTDIDLAVLLEEKMTDPFSYESHLEIELEKISGCPIDLRILNNAPLSFCYTVIQTGTVILDKKPDARSDFESRIIRQYLDFAYFQRRYLSEVTDAPI
ncbi:MAG: nucleotidyltransferase domain-containing protein [Deltaproteobacteria bacterium]|nr:nucleotidyltransferase domain-containing protein [Deltaproteobacteria bacterium]